MLELSEPLVWQQKRLGRRKCKMTETPADTSVFAMRFASLPLPVISLRLHLFLCPYISFFLRGMQRFLADNENGAVKTDDLWNSLQEVRKKPSVTALI